MEILIDDWIQGCQLRHPSPHDIKYKGTGQNLAATGGMKPNVTGFLNHWYKEKEFFSSKTLHCNSHAVCGHYTQVPCFAEMNIQFVCHILQKKDFR